MPPIVPTVATPTTTQPKTTVLPYTQPGQLVQPIAASYQPGAGVQQPQAGGMAVPTYSPEQMNAAVLQTAQQQAIQGFKSPVSQLTSQKTAELLQQPTQGLASSAQQYSQTQLEKYDVERANALDAARQQLAPTMNTGASRGKYVDLAMQGVQERTQLERDLETEYGTQQREAMFRALSEGRTQTELESGLYGQGINALTQVRGAAEGQEQRTFEQQQLETTFGMDMAKMLTNQDWQGAQASLDRDFQAAQQSQNLEAQSSIVERQIALDKWKQENGQTFTAEQNALNRALEMTLADKDYAMQTSLMELKSKLDTGILMTQQDFQGAQAELDRKAAEALQSGDIAGQITVMQQRAAIDTIAAQAERTWLSAERNATQVYNTSERLDEQGFTQTMAYFDRETQTALAANNFTYQKQLADDRAALELKMQTQNFTQDQKMASLNQELAEATANNDVTRQKQIMDYTYMQEMEVRFQEQGWEASMAWMNAEIQTALQNNQQTNAMSLLNAQQNFTREQAVLDRDIEWARVALQEKGVDMAQIEQQYTFIQNEVAAGRAAPEAATEFLQGVLGEQGITLPAADPNAVYAELDRDYRLQQYQWAQTHTEDGLWLDAEGNEVPAGTAGANFGGLKDTAAQGFSDFLNTSYYGPDGKPVIGGTSDLAAQGADYAWASEYVLSNPNPQALSIALKNADQPNNQNNEVYQQILASAPTLSPFISDNLSNQVGGIAKAGTVANIGGRLMVVISQQGDVGAGFGGGRKHDEFTLMDVATGQTRLFSGLSGDAYSANNVGVWVNEITNI